MKKTIKILSVLCIGSLFAGQIYAQSPTFVKGDNVAGATIGFGGYYSGVYWSGTGVSRLPFIAAYYEKCVKDNLFDENSSFGIGGMIGHTSITAGSRKASNTVIGARGVLHYAFVDKLDTYGGIMLGFDIYNSSHWAGSSGLGFSAFLGARYYVTEKFAVLAELGYGVSNINLGVSLKF
jgi:hypothetical protein